MVFEDKNLFEGLPIWEKILKGFFLSVTPRNAGFATLDYTQITQGSEMLTDLLMFIGAGSASTGGGIKVKEVHPNSMESKLIQNLYFAGEVLDVDALTGGFNLQIAWSTAWLAVKNMLEVDLNEF